MNVKFIREEIIEGKKSLFLGGPNPFVNGHLSWKNNFSEKLGEILLEGEIYFPYCNSQDLREIDKCWIKRAKENATAIVFWLPKNCEFTEYDRQVFIKDCFNKIVLFGYEEVSKESIKLSDIYRRITKKEPYNNFNDLKEASIDILNEKEFVKNKCS